MARVLGSFCLLLRGGRARPAPTGSGVRALLLGSFCGFAGHITLGSGRWWWVRLARPRTRASAPGYFVLADGPGMGRAVRGWVRFVIDGWRRCRSITVAGLFVGEWFGADGIGVGGFVWLTALAKAQNSAASVTAVGLEAM